MEQFRLAGTPGGHQPNPCSSRAASQGCSGPHPFSVAGLRGWRSYSLAGALVQHFNPLHCEKWCPPIQLVQRPCLPRQSPSLDGCCYCGILASSACKCMGLQTCNISVVSCLFWGIVSLGRKRSLIQNCLSLWHKMLLSQDFSLCPFPLLLLHPCSHRAEAEHRNERPSASCPEMGMAAQHLP